MNPLWIIDFASEYTTGNILTGDTDPTNDNGLIGDYYLNTQSNKFFGPKKGTNWPAGALGTENKNTLSGTSDPTDKIGQNGDFYINTEAKTIFGPKSNDKWPTGRSITSAFTNQIRSLKSTIVAPGRNWLKYSFYSEDTFEDAINVNDCIKTGSALFKPEGEDLPYFDDEKFNAHKVPTGGDGGTQPTFNFDIHFVCDVRKPYSHEALFKIVNKLKNSTFVETPNKYFYLHLWMPEGLNLSDRVEETDTEFFNLLHNFQKEFLFNYILIYTSIEAKVKKDDAFVQIFNAINLISVGSDTNSTKSIFNADFDHIDKENRFFLCEALGVYHERDVFVDQQAYILGDILLKAFKEKTEKPFVNNEVVNEIVKKANLDELLNPNHLNHAITSDFRAPDKPQNKIDLGRLSDKVLGGIKPSDSKTKALDTYIWNPAKLLNGFYLGFLFTIKKNLINEIQQEIQWKYEDFKKNVDEKARIVLAEKNQELDNQIFSIFNHQSPAKECSLQQALKINERIESKTKELYGKFESEKATFQFKETSGDEQFAYFPMTETYKNALETVNLTYAGMSSKEKQKKIVEHIETIVKNYPVVWWAQFTRVMLSVFCLIFITGPIIGLLSGARQSSFTDFKYMGIGAILSLIPLILFWWQNRQRKQVLVSMVNQYIAVALEELNEKALNHNRDKVAECMQMVCSYLAWVKTDKIQKRLIGGLRLQKPKDFSFMPTESLQPLFTIPLVVEDLKDGTAKQKNHVSKIESAAFGIPKEPLFKDLSQITTKVKCSSGQITLIDLVQDDDKKVELLHDLMSQKVKINEAFGDATISAEPKLNILLLLDVSGSMRGQSFETLKKVVSKLKVSHQDNLHWIAFSDEAKTETECEGEIPPLFGFTNLKKAFDKAEELNAFNFDKVILVSDGLPTNNAGQFINDIEKQNLCQDAYSLNKPLDVIYIGNDGNGKAFMKLLAETTGGKSYEQTIESLDERLKQSMKIKYEITGVDQTKKVDELLQMGHTEAINSAISEFCRAKLMDVSSSIEEYLEHKGSSEDGIISLLKSATMLPNSHNSSDENHKPYLIYKFNHGASIEPWLKVHKNNSGLVSTLVFKTHEYYEIPNIFNTVVGIRPLGPLMNLDTEDKLKDQNNFKKSEVWDLIKTPVNIKNESIAFKNKQD